MYTVGDYLEDVALMKLIQRGLRNNLYFHYGNRSEDVFVITQDHHYKPLEEFKLFGGTIVTLGELDQLNMFIKERGDYVWKVVNKEAYEFCKKIYSYLGKHDQYRFDFCQTLMMEYLCREGNSNR